MPPMQATAAARPMMIAEQDTRAAQAPPTAPAEPAAHTTTRRSAADSDAPAEAEVMAPDTPAVQVPEMHEEQVQDTAEQQWQELSRMLEAAENREELQQKLQEPSDWIANVGTDIDASAAHDMPFVAHHACDSHTPYISLLATALGSTDAQGGRSRYNRGMGEDGRERGTITAGTQDKCTERA